MAVRRGASLVEDQDLETAADRLTLGAPRGRQMALQQQQPELLQRLGSHEAGLALTSLLLMRYEGALIEPPQRLSVAPRGEVRGSLSLPGEGEAQCTCRCCEFHSVKRPMQYEGALTPAVGCATVVY